MLFLCTRPSSHLCPSTPTPGGERETTDRTNSSTSPSSCPIMPFQGLHDELQRVMSTSSESNTRSYDVYARRFAALVCKSRQARKMHIRLKSATITEDDNLRYDFFTRPEPDRDVEPDHFVDEEYQLSDPFADVCPWRLAHRAVLEELRTSDEAADVLNLVLIAELNHTFALGMNANTFSVDGSVEWEVGGETHRVLLIAPVEVDDFDGSEPDSAYGSALE
jgi:hypothetical protein